MITLNSDDVEKSIAIWYTKDSLAHIKLMQLCRDLYETHPGDRVAYGVLPYGVSEYISSMLELAARGSVNTYNSHIQTIGFMAANLPDVSGIIQAPMPEV